MHAGLLDDLFEHLLRGHSSHTLDHDDPVHLERGSAGEKGLSGGIYRRHANGYSTIEAIQIEIAVAFRLLGWSATLIH